MKGLDEVNGAIEAASPVLYACLSELGRAAVFPHGIPAQAGEARGTTYNGTIGQITDGRGGAVRLPALGDSVVLESEDANRAFLYSPIQGIEEVRDRWRTWHRRGQPDHVPSTRPQPVLGLTQGLSIAAELFGGRDRAVAVPTPFWGNYRQIFTLRTGTTIVSAPGFHDGRYNCDAIEEALSSRPEGEPALAILNLPANPTGYSLTAPERVAVRESLVRAASKRPLVVLCDDAYAGLVYEDDVPTASMFWELVGASENLIPIKIDGATKEFSFFGGRVGFLTFPFQPESDIATALESKVKCLVRSSVGSPVALSQTVLLQGLRSHAAEAEFGRIRAMLAERYRALKAALSEVDRGLLEPLPFNSGCFALVALSSRVKASSEELRRHLLEKHDTGVISIAPNYLRVAFCSVATEALPELVRRVEAGARELAG